MHFFVSSFSSMVCYFFLEDTDICNFVVFLNRTPTSTQLYLPSTSFTHLRPAHFRLHPALCNTLKDQNIARNWAISCWASSPFLLKIGTHGILERLIPNTDNLKFQPQNSFLMKFESKKSKLSVLLKNWHTWYHEAGDSYSNISFLVKGRNEPINKWLDKWDYSYN